MNRGRDDVQKFKEMIRKALGGAESKAGGPVLSINTGGAPVIIGSNNVVRWEVREGACHFVGAAHRTDEARPGRRHPAARFGTARIPRLLSPPRAAKRGLRDSWKTFGAGGAAPRSRGRN